MTDLERMAAAIAGEHKPTICTDCANLFRVNAKDHWVKWLCLASPTEQISYVTGKLDPPYRFCRFINFGDCIMFKPGINSLSPDKLQENKDGSHTQKDGE